MSEDLSATVRLGVTYVMLSCTVIFIVVMVYLGTARLNELSGYMSAAVSTMEQTTLINISGQYISGAGAYRICKSSEGAFSKFQIKMKNGNTYNSIDQLLEAEFLSAKYYVNSKQVGNGGMWEMILEER